MGISGNLKTMQLAELLQWLSMGQKTGTLMIEKGPPSNVVKRIFFDEGVIISSASTDPGEYLGRFLVTHGYLAEDAVNQAVSRQKEEKQLLGKILVSMGLIAEEDLHQMLRLKAEETIYDIFTWDEGAFEFLDNELPLETMVRMELDVQWIVLEGTRRTDEWTRIQQVISSPLCVPVLVRDLDALELDEFDRSLLEWVDDDRTVGEISEGAMTNLFQVSEIMANLVQQGVLKVVRPRIIEKPVEVLVERNEDEEDARERGKKMQAIDPNESGAFFLPMMQQMMAQQMQMMAQQGMTAPAPGAPAAGAPAAAPPPAVMPAPAPAPAPTGGMDLGGGRQLSFATPAGAAGGAEAPAASAPAPTPTPDRSAAEQTVQEAEAALRRGDLVEALERFRKAKEADGAGPEIEARVEAGEKKLIESLENRGVNSSRVPRLKCDMGELTKLDISPQEGFMLTRVDGSYDIKSILRMTPMPKVDALLLFWKLRESGHLAL